MSDLIDRQLAIDVLEEAKKTYFDRKVVIGKTQDIINNLPSVQLEIIRCKDCVKYDFESRQCNRQICASFYENDFCSYAERREDG